MQGQVQSLQNENDDLKNQIQILKGTLLNTYSSDEINSVIEQGGLKRDISKRLDNLECLDSVDCEQVPSVKVKIYMEPLTAYRIVLTLPTPHGPSSSWTDNMIPFRQILLHRKIQIVMQI